MLTYHQIELLTNLRERSLKYIIEVEKLFFQDTGDPIPIQTIWTSIFHGYKEGLGRAIIYAKEVVGDDLQWRETLDAAELAQLLWMEFERVHGDESLLDFSRFDEATMNAFGIKTGAHAERLVAIKGQSYRDAAVTFELWIYPQLHRPQSGPLEAA